MTGIEAIESAIVDEFAGRITREQAIRRIQSVLNVTDVGAADLMDHVVAARERYSQITTPRN